MNYVPGNQIKSHDFPGKDRKQYFVEGEVLHVDQEGGWLEIQVTFDSLANEKHSRVGDKIMVPIKTELDTIWEYERIEILNK